MFSKKICRLSYCSISTIPVDQTPVEVAAILDVAVPANEALHITGSLTLVRSFFFQVLEGSEDAIETTITRIAADRRHKDVKILSRHMQPRRMFSEWTMAFAPPRSRDRDAAHKILETAHRDDSADVSRMIDYLRSWTLPEAPEDGSPPAAQGRPGLFSLPFLRPAGEG